MVNGALQMLPGACDFTFQENYPLLELLNGERIEILLGQERDRIAGARKILFGIHDRER